MRLFITLIVAWCVMAINAHAQQTRSQIQVYDIETSSPIADISFQYGDQKGVSSADGTIEFIYLANQTMTFSHVNYGIWQFTDEEVQEAIGQQIIYRKRTTINLHPVTVIGLRNQPETPESQVTIAYPERMEHDAASILDELPSFNSIRKSGNYGFDPVFRGFKYDQLNVVLNGAQSANAACPNRMDPPSSQMAPNMMERIDVLKGPYALRFGTGFGATINFVPMPLRFSATPTFYGRVSAGFEGNGEILRGETQLGYSLDDIDISVFGSWSQGNDYTDGNGEIVQADFTRGSFGTNLGFRLSKRQQLRLSATYNRARDADFPALPMDLREDDTWLFNARHDIWFSSGALQNWNTTLYGSFVNHLMDNLLKDLDPRMMNASTLAKTHNYGLRSEGVWNFGANHKLYTGVDWRAEGASGIRERDFLMGPNAGKVFEDNVWQDSYISKIGVFGEYQYKGHFANYVLSGRLEFNSANVNDAAADFTTNYTETAVNQFNPSLSLGVLKPLGEHYELGLWVGRAQRSAGLTERYINYFPVGQDPYEMLGNPNLSPEVNNQIDLTFSVAVNNNIRFSIDVFGAYMENLISSVIDTSLSPRMPTSPGVRQFVNISGAYKTGFEMSYTQILFAGLQHQLSMAYTYAQDAERNEPLPEIAPLDIRYTLLGTYFSNKLKPQITVRLVAEQMRISTEFGETVTPGFALLDLKVSYQFNRKFNLIVGADNILNAAYYEHLNRSVRGTTKPIFAPGTNVFVKLSYLF